MRQPLALPARWVLQGSYKSRQLVPREQCCMSAHLEGDAGSSCCLEGWDILGRVLHVGNRADKQRVTDGCALPAAAQVTLAPCMHVTQPYMLQTPPSGQLRRPGRTGQDATVLQCLGVRLHPHRHRQVAVQEYAAVLAQCSHHRGPDGEVGGKGTCSSASSAWCESIV